MTAHNRNIPAVQNSFRDQNSNSQILKDTQIQLEEQRLEIRLTRLRQKKHYLAEVRALNSRLTRQVTDLERFAQSLTGAIKRREAGLSRAYETLDRERHELAALFEIPIDDS
jgi:uncharacterized protein (DUF3084 family)